MDISKNPVLIIGGGLAGLTCATKLAHAGCPVIVFEASSDELYPCNSRFSGGLFHIASDDMVAPEKEILERIQKSTDNTSDPALAAALARNSRPMLDWLRQCGVSFMKAGPDGLRKFSLVPPRVRKTGLHWRGRCGDTMLRTLEKRLLADGGQFLRGHVVQDLLTKDGEIVGIRLDNGLEWQGSAVVICDGGFQANGALLKEHMGINIDKVLMRNARSGVGAGIEMGLRVGAALKGMGSFYGHVHHRDAMQDERLWPFPVLDSVCTAGILVSEAGRRFCDEGLGGVYCANEIARLDNPDKAWAIFDEDIWNGPGRDWLLPANPYLLSAGSIPIMASSIDELSRKAELPYDALSDEIRQYNRAISSGLSIFPGKSEKVYKHRSLDIQRLMALPVVAGVTYTTGGISISSDAQVYGADGTILPKLYAAGACTGGLEGGPHHGYTGGLSKAAIFGFIAARKILREEAS